MRVAERGNVPNLVGLVVIDVVEGSAMEALSGMVTILVFKRLIILLVIISYHDF